MDQSTTPQLFPSDRIPDCLWRMGMDWRLIEVSHAAEIMFGIPADAMVGSHLRDHTTAEDFAKLEERMSQALGLADRTISRMYETRIRHAEGHLVEVEIHSRVLLDSEGNPDGLIGVTRDISGRRLAEGAARELENKRLQDQKMDAVTQLASGMVGDLEALTQALADCPELATKPELSSLHVHASKRVEELRILAGKQPLDRRDLDLDEVLNGILDSLKVELPSNVVLLAKPGAGVSTLSIDSDQLAHVIRALVFNARDAMPDGGLITVTTGQREAEVDEDAPPAAAPPPWLTIAVTDTGGGLDRATRERILEPFFTTKDGHAGLGLGLVHGIIHQHGGHLEVESERGRSSTFRIILPARYASLADDLDEPEASDRTVLVVDDDPSIRSYVSMVLKSAGFAVVACEDGMDALAYISGEDPVDLVLLDWALPGLDGRMVREQMTRRNKHLPLMIISGYDREPNEARGTIDADTPWLKKPFTPSALLAAIQDLLASPAP